MKRKKLLKKALKKCAWMLPANLIHAACENASKATIKAMIKKAKEKRIST